MQLCLIVGRFPRLDGLLIILLAAALLLQPLACQAVVTTHIWQPSSYSLTVLDSSSWSDGSVPSSAVGSVALVNASVLTSGGSFIRMKLTAADSVQTNTSTKAPFRPWLLQCVGSNSCQFEAGSNLEFDITCSGATATSGYACNFEAGVVASSTRSITCDGPSACNFWSTFDNRQGRAQKLNRVVLRCSDPSAPSCGVVALWQGGDFSIDQLDVSKGGMISIQSTYLYSWPSTYTPLYGGFITLRVDQVVFGNEAIALAFSLKDMHVDARQVTWNLTPTSVTNMLSGYKQIIGIDGGGTLTVREEMSVRVLYEVAGANAADRKVVAVIQAASDDSSERWRGKLVLMGLLSVKSISYLRSFILSGPVSTSAASRIDCSMPPPAVNVDDAVVTWMVARTNLTSSALDFGKLPLDVHGAVLEMGSAEKYAAINVAVLTLGFTNASLLRFRAKDLSSYYQTTWTFDATSVSSTSGAAVSTIISLLPLEFLSSSSSTTSSCSGCQNRQTLRFVRGDFRTPSLLIKDVSMNLYGQVMYSSSDPVYTASEVSSNTLYVEQLKFDDRSVSNHVIELLSIVVVHTFDWQLRSQARGYIGQPSAIQTGFTFNYAAQIVLRSGALWHTYVERGVAPIFPSGTSVIYAYQLSTSISSSSYSSQLSTDTSTGVRRILNEGGEIRLTSQGGAADTEYARTSVITLSLGVTLVQQTSAALLNVTGVGSIDLSPSYGTPPPQMGTSSIVLFNANSTVTWTSYADSSMSLCRPASSSTSYSNMLQGPLTTSCRFSSQSGSGLNPSDSLVMFQVHGVTLRFVFHSASERPDVSTFNWAGLLAAFADTMSSAPAAVQNEMPFFLPRTVSAVNETFLLVRVGMSLQNTGASSGASGEYLRSQLKNESSALRQSELFKSLDVSFTPTVVAAVYSDLQPCEAYGYAFTFAGECPKQVKKSWWDKYNGIVIGCSCAFLVLVAASLIIYHYLRKHGYCDCDAGLLKMSFQIHSLTLWECLFGVVRYLPVGSPQNGATYNQTRLGGPDTAENSIGRYYGVFVALKALIIVAWGLDAWMGRKRGVSLFWKIFPFSLFVTPIALADFETYKMIRFFTVTLIKVAVNAYLLSEMRVYEWRSDSWSSSPENRIISGVFLGLSCIQALKEFLLFLDDVQEQAGAAKRTRVVQVAQAPKGFEDIDQEKEGVPNFLAVIRECPSDTGAIPVVPQRTNEEQPGMAEQQQMTGTQGRHDHVTAHVAEVAPTVPLPSPQAQGDLELRRELELMRQQLAQMQAHIAQGSSSPTSGSPAQHQESVEGDATNA